MNYNKKIQKNVFGVSLEGVEMHVNSIQRSICIIWLICLIVHISASEIGIVAIVYSMYRINDG